LRHYGWLRGALDSLLSKPLADPFIDRLLIISLYQLLYSQTAAYAVVDHAVHVATAHDDGRLKALVNAILRNFQRRRAELTAALKREPVAFWNHPDWWIGVVQQTWPRDWKQILTVANQHPPMTLRVNVRRTTPEAYLATLTAAEMPATLHASGAITLTKPVPVDKLPGFAEGVVSVQDAGAQLAASWLEVKDGMRVLDACAAPGGKTGHLLEIADLDLTAVDVDTARLARVSSNLARLGLSAQTVTGDAAAAVAACHTSAPALGAAARFHPQDDKRGTLDLCFRHLAGLAPADVVAPIALPEGSPYGGLAIDKDKCTLCLACINACPVKALSDDESQPRLRFREASCVQCGLCVATCPEDALQLSARLDLRPSAKQPQTLNEDTPCHCVSCGKPFGSTATVQAMVARLSGHSLFATPAQQKRLLMCGDCRVIDMLEHGKGQAPETTVFDL
jgi:ferredoxin